MISQSYLETPILEDLDIFMITFTPDCDDVSCENGFCHFKILIQDKNDVQTHSLNS